MDSIIVKKTAGLKGSVMVQGGKNAVLPILAASILTKEKVRIYNCPDIEDVRYTIKLLEMLGCKVFFANGMVDIYPKDVEDTRVSEKYTENTRSSIVFLGAMLGRLKKTVITKPGGCKIGARPLDMHIEGIKKMNVTIFEKYGDVVAFTDELTGADIKLPFPSVGATENIMICAVLAKGITFIRNAAKEPEIIELAKFMNSMGARIRGAGSDTMEIEGVEQLSGTEFRIGGDRIVAATYMSALAVTGGKVTLNGIDTGYMEAVIKNFSLLGMRIKKKENALVCKMRGKKRKIRNINILETEPYPGFPTDVQPMLTAVLTYGQGVSKIRENIFENRFMYVKELEKLGADINLRNKNTAVIYGKEKLYGTEVEAMDLRGGAALIVAGLGAEGKTTITSAKYIKRGYENIVRDLQLLGADIREEITGENEEREKK